MSGKGYSETPILRSMIISLSIGIGSLAAAFLIRMLIFTGEISVTIDLSLGVVLTSIFYIFTMIGEANWREYKRDIAGWWDIIGLLLITIILTALLFSWITVVVTTAIALTATYIIYKMQ